MRIIVCCIFSLWVHPAFASVLTWPGPAPCNGTLEACVLNAGSGDVVRVAANTIDGPVDIINKSLTLGPAPGYLPRFADDLGVLINLTDGGNYNVSVRGLQFDSGRIGLIHTDGDASVLVERNRFGATAGNNAAIALTSDSNSGADFDYRVRFNAIQDNSSFTGAIRVEGSGSGSRSHSGVIEGNQISLQENNSDGIVVLKSQGSTTFETRIFGNTIENAGSLGIQVQNTALGGGLTAFVYSNLVFSRNKVERAGTAISVRSFAGPITANIINNSMLAHNVGLEVSRENVGAVDVTISNNLLARNEVAMALDNEASSSEQYNLFHDNDTTPTALATTSIEADPLFHPNWPGRLLVGSPAIDAGSNAATSTLPGLDALGSSRYIGGTTDIGAVEYGDTWLTAIKPVAGANNFTINADVLDGQPGKTPFITQVFNPYDRNTGVYNAANVGVYYSLGLWRIFNQSTASAMPENAAFSVYVPGSSLTADTHSNTVEASTTTINRGITNDQPDSLVFVTQHWNRAGGGVYNDHPVGMLYAAGFWRIANMDLADIPVGADFNFYAPRESFFAFEHIARGDGIDGYISLLRHPLLDGNPCARLQVTQSANQGIFNANPVGVFYNGANWGIFNQNFASMADNAEFHVLVDPNSGSCQLFSDRFEEGRF
jgi:hypothetical protein